MKARFGLLVIFAVLSTLLVSATTSPAEAAPFGARLSRTPIVGESVTVYGAVPPARRPVRLLVYRSGRWVGAGSSVTGAGGRYTFRVRATASAVAYRVFAPKKKIKRKKRPARYSNVVRVRGVRPSMSLAFVPAPVGIATSGNTARTDLLTPGLATFRPARPGSLVRIQRLQNKTWTTVLGGTGRQDATGTFKFKGIAAGSDSDVRTFRAVSSSSSGGAYGISSSVVPTHWANGFEENFTDNAASDDNWVSRPSSTDTNRPCAWPDQNEFRPDASHGIASLWVERQSSNPTANNCSSTGFWLNAVVGTANATHPYTQKYGLFAARIKFHGRPGAHGGFWLQGLGSQSAEVDTEYFGDGRSDGGLFNFVHVVNGTQTISSGGARPAYKSILTPGQTLSNSWHVFSIQWSPTGYIYRVDGVPTFSTNQPRVAAVAQEIMLSLATSQYELPGMQGRNSASMQVDWVRTWKYPGF